MRLRLVLPYALTAIVCLNCAQGQRLQGSGGNSPDRILQTLDSDRDGILSTEELLNAAVALSELDTDGDGQLQPGEWSRRGGSGPEGPRRRQRPQERRPDPPRSPFSLHPPHATIGGFDPLLFIARVFSHDKNGDGTLSNEELPAPLEHLLGKNDANKDGSLSKAELETSLQRFEERFQASNRRDGRGRPRPRPRR